MRQDQFEKLQALEEKLLDVFLAEADPDAWPGKGLKLGDMDSKTRGDLYWVRKTAASAAVLRGKVVQILEVQQGLDVPGTPSAGEPGADDESQLDAEISAAEREAKRLMDELTSGTSKAKKAFDKRAHGKASS